MLGGIPANKIRIGRHSRFLRLRYHAVKSARYILARPKNEHHDRFSTLIRQLEKKRKTRIFSMIQVGEDDDNSQICGHTFATIFAGHKKMEQVPTIELLLDSPGGDANVAYSLVRYFRQHCKKLNVIVPMYAKSAATLMALGADTIHMGCIAELGPIDVQMKDPLKTGSKRISPLDEFKSAEYLRDYAVELLDSFMLLIIKRSGMSVRDALHDAIDFTTAIMRPLYEQINPLQLGEHARSLAIGEDYAVRLLTMARNPKGREIVKALVSKYPSHSFVIDALEARLLGLPVQALPKAEEHIFIEAVNCIQESGVSFYGFTQEPVQKPKSSAPRKGKVDTTKKLPASVTKVAA